ncbi:MAG: hypothetical protein WCP14_04460 [bacterium]
MKHKILWIYMILSFIGLSLFYYYIHIQELDKTFLTISTFVFSIFMGFFISRQDGRYDKIRQNLSQFDGDMSSIYRALCHLGPDVQDRAGEIIKRHYDNVIGNDSWDCHIIRESTTVTDLHELVEDVASDKKLSNLQNTTVMRVLLALHDLQITRKGFIASYQERLPKVQWLLVDVLALIVLINISAIFSQYLVFTSLLKATFGTAIVLTLLLLQQLDNLALFEGAVGEDSAKDVVNIIRE